MTQIYNLAQSFFVDAAAVKGATRVSISSIELFFQQKPNPSGNKSNIQDPGVTLLLCAVDADKKPILEQIVSGSSTNDIARVEYADIRTSADASIATKFSFAKPILVDTNKDYAFLVKYDGNEDYILWASKQGDTLVGTNTPSPGPSGKYVGNYYTKYVTSGTPGGPSTDWKFLSDTDLKFRVYCARYSINGNPVSNVTFAANVAILTPGKTDLANVTPTANGTKFSVATGRYEYIIYDKKRSKPQVRGGEWVYQNTVPFPGGTATPLKLSVTIGSDLIVANNNLPGAANTPFNWSTVYGSSNDLEYIVVIEEDPNDGSRRTDIRRVVSIESNTILRVDEAMNFTSTNAYFIKSPVARVDFLDKSKSFDYKFNDHAFKRRVSKQDLLVLTDSNANASHRFVNDSITSVSVTTPGSGYSNTDYVAIFGYEDSTEVKGGYPAIANIVTNGTGNVSAIYLSNVGAGFINTANLKFVISNSSFSPASLNASSSNTANGSAVFSVVVGSMLRAEFNGQDRLGGYFANVDVINVKIDTMFPHFQVNHPAGTQYNSYWSTPYYQMYNSNTYLGVTYRIDSDRSRNRRLVRAFAQHGLPYKNTPVLPSRSNEFIIIDDSSNTPNTAPPPGTGTLEIEAISNNDFVCIVPNNVAVTFSKLNINNDYTGENTNYGNAHAKHITTKVNFKDGRFAEDLRVYLTAYRPLNTDIKVFARIHNSKDTEAFDDKDWTMLELKDGNIYSSSAKPDDYIEMTFGFQQYPNVAWSYTGSVGVASNTTATVTGNGTSFSTSVDKKLYPNDLVKITNPLFPTTYAIRVVTAVASDYSFTINKPIGNNDLVGTGLKLELIGRVGNSTVNAVGYPLQAYNNYLNDNVVRYHTSSMAVFDTYDSMQLKIVMLGDISQVSNSDPNSIPTNVPRIDDIRAIGVTA